MIRYLCNVNSKPLLDMKSRYLPIMIVFLVLLGCCGRKPTTTVPDSMYPLTLIDTSQIRPDVMKVISSCIKEYPTQKAFILNCWYLYEDHGFLSSLPLQALSLSPSRGEENFLSPQRFFL